MALKLLTLIKQSHIMKKIIAVIAFFAITLLGTDATFAQDGNARNLSADAKTYTKELSTTLNLDGTKQRAIYNAHMLRNRKINALKTAANDYRAMEKGGKLSSKATEYIAEFNAKIKTILSKEQFAKYQGISTKKKA